MDAGDDVVELKEVVVVDGGNVFDNNSTSYHAEAAHDTGASTNGGSDGAAAAAAAAGTAFAGNEKTNGTLSKQNSNMPLMSGFANAVHNFAVGETKPNKIQPLTVSFHNLSFAIKQKKKKKDPSTHQPKVLLHPMSGVVRPGELLAVMGATGAGKTTVLNLLAGRMTSGIIGGEIRFNGYMPPKKFGVVSGYVMQEDILYESLTVRETLTYVAMLRLGKTVTVQERNERVQNLVDELGLRKCIDTKVGGQIVRGISGGEKKRVSIACELIGQPSLLFLDEPTSGLDSFTAYNVMESMRKIAASGRTVISTIHQPRSNIFALFDKIMLLSDGHIVYFGPANESPKYFAEIGYPVEQYSNPTDHFLDTISVDRRSEERETTSQERVTKIISFYATSESRNKMELAAAEVPLNGNKKYPLEHRYNANFFMQLYTLFMRAMTNQVRSKQAGFFRLIPAVFTGIIFGLIYLSIPDNDQGVQTRAGLLFLILLQEGFGSMFSVLTLFQTERALILRERSAGLYRTSAFYLAKVFADMPVQVLEPLVFATIVYWMAGLQPIFWNYFMMMLTIELGAFAAGSMGLVISCLVPSVQVANAVAPLVLVILMIFGGFYTSLSTIPVFLSWIKYISWISWAFGAMMYIEFTGLTFTCDPAPCAIPNGEVALQVYGFSDVNLAVNLGVLAAIIVFFNMVAYFALLRLRPKNT